MDGGQPLPAILDLGQTQVGVLPEIEEFLTMLCGYGGHLMLRNVHAAQEVLEARMDAERSPDGIIPKERNR